MVQCLPREIVLSVAFYDERVYYWKMFDAIPSGLYRLLKEKEVVSEFNRMKVCNVCPLCEHLKQDVLIRMFDSEKARQLLCKLGYELVSKDIDKIVFRLKGR
jgi:hypothetical protein